MPVTTTSQATTEHQLRDALAGVGKAIGHPHRLRLLELLAQRAYRVEQLAELCDLNMASTSQHLQQLRRAGLITARREGRQMIYRLTDDRIVDLLGLVRDIAQSQLAEVERLLGQLFPQDIDEAPTEVFTRERLLQGLENGSVTLLDVRPGAEFEAGHLPGARHLTLAELKQHLHELPADRTIVAYCRGPYCTLSHQAVAYLRQQGYRVARLADGFPEWKRAGLPVEEG
ncbi:metalloregulator ArsR/SmtB family transcription factor [Natronospirillum operosum]|uniref:Metalloregulator ArsR/SmtB family transcription factor n=1 Tax=Natronospirillum operosum TaxID=2759953 RepID=A0A4Z0WDN0_9GAMM|nr:metalloregulator ArsR/SmtB family transcription factor [Natronospirillum operosum]TGG93332.1 metalloregulator ArsR/SmtB family transcription factor [Natronospirillum operosum]